MVEGINVDKVTFWLTERIPSLRPPLQFELIAGGHSNLTFKFTDTQGRALVLRRPPLGHVLESAHDMGREHRIVSAVAKTEVPVPATFGLCEDKDVNGAPFYVMEYVDGIVPHTAAPLQSMPNEERRSFGLHVIEVLGHLHNTDPEQIGLGQLARREGYLDRQLKRWTQQYVATQTHQIPDMDTSLELLQKHKPEQVGYAIVHGDYRPGNMLIKAGKVAALLDWELCTLGDPLADVGYLLNNWSEPDDPGAESSPTGIGGFPLRSEMMAGYEAATGRSLADINYYRAFSHWRLGAIAQGVYKRYSVGAMGDQEFDLEKYHEGILAKALAARQLLEA